MSAGGVCFFTPRKRAPVALGGRGQDIAKLRHGWYSTVMFRHVLCVFPYRHTRSSKTSFPPLGLEYVAAALRPYAERIELVNFRHQRTPGTQPLLRPETDLVCYSINWPENLDLIRDDINALPPGVMTILGGRTATENPRYWLEACPERRRRGLRRRRAGDGRDRPGAAVAGDRRPGPPRPRRPIGLQPAAGQRALGRRPDARPGTAPPRLLPDEQGREHGDQGRPGRRLAGLPVPLQVLQLRHQPVGREAVLDAALARSRSSARSSRSTPTWSCSSTTCSRISRIAWSRSAIC